MSQNKLLACPAQLHAVQHYLKLAVDYEARDVVITYWARLYSLQAALKLDKKSPEARILLANLMDWLETFKKTNLENEAITNDVAGQALLENEATKLFNWADSNDRAAVFSKNVVKSFYTAGVILDVCDVFGDLSEEVIAQRKYAKWKATYIHNCLKKGETPIPGPIGGDGLADEGELNINVPQYPEHHQPAAPPPDMSQPGLPNPGFQQPFTPPAAAPAMTPVEASSPMHQSQESSGGVAASAVPPAVIKQARKFLKWADSALDYQDIQTAVENLNKAVALLSQPN